MPAYRLKFDPVPGHHSCVKIVRREVLPHSTRRLIGVLLRVRISPAGLDARIPAQFFRNTHVVIER
jgi:hypothetical protein